MLVLRILMTGRHAMPDKMCCDCFLSECCGVDSCILESLARASSPSLQLPSSQSCGQPKTTQLCYAVQTLGIHCPFVSELGKLLSFLFNKSEAIRLNFSQFMGRKSSSPLNLSFGHSQLNSLVKYMHLSQSENRFPEFRIASNLIF